MDRGSASMSSCSEPILNEIVSKLFTYFVYCLSVIHRKVLHMTLGSEASRANTLSCGSVALKWLRFSSRR
jgi:hypothetical protein